MTVNTIDLTQAYATQVVFGNGWREPKDVVCTCGHIRKVEHNQGAGECPSCGTDRIKTAYPSELTEFKFADNLYHVIYKDDQSFHVARQEFVVTATRESVTFRPTKTGELKFSLKDKVIHVYRDGKKITSTDTHVNDFFRNASKSQVLDLISTEHNRELFNFCYDKLGRMGYERNHMWGRGLQRLKEYPAVEIFGLSLLSNHIHRLWSGFRHILKDKHIQPQPPHKMLGVPKFFIPYLAKMDYLGEWSLNKLKKLLEHFDGNSVKMVFDIFHEENDLDNVPDVVDTLIELFNDYGYNNLKRLVLYITREVKLEQGITNPDEAITLLRDYVRMCQAMELGYEKYPKSLKKEHDIALMNYKANESEIKQKQFAKVVESEDYVSLDFKTKDYAIIRPTTVNDVIKEGESLSHCVASYVDDIIKKKCKILFLRRTDNLNESLVTVEVRGHIIRQVKGKFNRKPTEEEKEFVHLWAKNKNLVVQSY